VNRPFKSSTEQSPVANSSQARLRLAVATLPVPEKKAASVPQRCLLKTTKTILMETGGRPMTASDVERVAKTASDAIVRAGSSGIVDIEERSEIVTVLRQLSDIAKEENGTLSH
jgi:hypothetical protein